MDLGAEICRYSLSEDEMEKLRSAFHAQLTSVMDTLLAAAVSEIAKVFESSLCEHQAALLQRTNEISILRSELQKVERRCADVVLTVSADEKPTPEIKQVVKQEPNPLHISPDDATLWQNRTAIKEEVTLDEAIQPNFEHCGSQPNLELAISETSEIQLSINQQKPLSPEKNKTPDGYQSNLSTAQLTEEESHSRPLSLSPKGCSDTSRTEGRSQGINTVQESTMENFQSNKLIWSAPVNTRTAFDVDETVSKDNIANFLVQESESPVYSPGMLHSAQGGEGGLKNRTRQNSPLRLRDRPQSCFRAFVLRSTDSHCSSGSTVTGRPYSCPYCAKCFAYPSHQRRHLQRHTGVRLHSCQFCEKRFLTPSELTVHTRTHTGERPFSCGQCGKRFARSGNLRAHQRDVHLGKRPFTCTECGKKFAHKGNLRVHSHRVHQQQQQPCHIDSESV